MPCVCDLAAEGEAEFELRVEPFRPEGEAVLPEIVEHIDEIRPDVVRQHEAVVQRRAPAHEAAVERVLPETRDDGAHQQLLREAHARIGRHLEAAELDQPEPAGRAVGREQLVDADFRAVRIAGDVGQQVAEQPVDQPGQGAAPLPGSGTCASAISSS